MDQEFAMSAQGGSASDLIKGCSQVVGPRLHLMGAAGSFSKGLTNN